MMALSLGIVNLRFLNQRGLGETDTDLKTWVELPIFCGRFMPPLFGQGSIAP